MSINTYITSELEAEMENTTSGQGHSKLREWASRKMALDNTKIA